MAQMSFGEVLSGLRKNQELSQNDLAKLLHIHITTIKNWEDVYGNRF